MKKMIFVLMIAFVLGSFNVYAIIGICPPSGYDGRCGCEGDTFCELVRVTYPHGSPEYDCENVPGPACDPGYICRTSGIPMAGECILCDNPEVQCPSGNVCYDPVCTSNGCDVEPVPAGNQDGDCGNDVSAVCIQPPCVCDGAGTCISNVCNADDNENCCDGSLGMNYYSDTSDYLIPPNFWTTAGETGVGNYNDMTSDECCGDDLLEYYSTKVVNNWACYGNDCAGITTDQSINSCCDTEHDCVYEINGNAECFAPGDIIDLDLTDELIDGVCMESNYIACAVNGSDSVVGISPCACGTAICETGDICVSGLNTCQRFLWNYETGDDITSSPAIGHDGNIYVGSKDGRLRSFDVEGALLWESDWLGDIVSTPAISDDESVYVTSWNTKIYAFNPDGSYKWSPPYSSPGGYLKKIPAIGIDGNIYIGSTNDNLYALDPATGNVVWTFLTSGNNIKTVAVAGDGSIYVANYYTLYKLDSSGNEIWSSAVTSGEFTTSPVIGASGEVYLATSGDKLIRFNPSNGYVDWEISLEVRTPPVIGTDGTIYAGTGTANNIFYALDPQDGHEIWNIALTPGQLSSSPLIASDGTIYLGTSYGIFYAIDSYDGVTKWVYWDILGTFNDIPSSPVLGSDGTIYFGSRSNKLYALATSSTGLAESSWPKFRQNIQNTGQQP